MSSLFSFSNSKGAIILVLIWFFIFTPFSQEADLFSSHFFYNEGIFTHHTFWHSIYLFGFYPAWIVGLLALTLYILSFFSSACEKWRRPSLYLVLTFAIGSGLIINGILKEQWGRPRPRQVEEFGGTRPYLPYYAPSLERFGEAGKSFPSGHASCGFYFFALAFLGVHYRIRSLYVTGIALAIGIGSLLSLSRIAEGGHFLSDTLASAWIMWLTCWALGRWLFAYQGVNSGRINT